LAAGVLDFLATVCFAGRSVARVFFAAFLAFGFFMACRSITIERAAQIYSGLLPAFPQGSARAAHTSRAARV